MRVDAVSVYTDLRQLIELKDGIALSDVSLVGSDGTEEIKAHKCAIHTTIMSSAFCVDVCPT